MSFLSRLPGAEKDKVKAEVAQILAKHGLHRPEDPFVLRYVTDLYLYRKLG